jgi:hypothetical protein
MRYRSLTLDETRKSRPSGELHCDGASVPTTEPYEWAGAV